MNLERISFKINGGKSLYITLAKISDFSKLYTTILFDQSFSMQKINNGDSIQAFNFKNIEQFKGFRPFRDYNQDSLLHINETYGSDFLYQTKLHAGDLVRYNGLKYVVLGIVVNTYAQWNMPTPLLFNPTNVNNDFKSLYGSRLTEEQINSKINDNFQAGKYDADMVIPLVDANDFSEYITVVEPRPTRDEVDIMFDSVKAEKNLTIKSQKDVFIDTMLRLRGNEINKIKEVNEDLFKGVQTLLLSVNKAVNEQIELLPEPVVEKPERKPRKKKVVEEVEPVVESTSEDLPDFISEFTIVKDLPEPIIKLARFRRKNQGKRGDIDLGTTLSSAFNWDDSSEGINFWSKISNEGDLREFKKLYGNKGEKVDEIIAKEEDLPDFINKRIDLKRLPEPVKKLALFRQKEQDKPFNENVPLFNAFKWSETPEGEDFWELINTLGDLRGFKEKYGNKGEKVDDLIDFEDLSKFVETDFFPKEPVVETQEVKYVEVIVYPPSGGVLNLKAFSIGEMIMVFDYLWDRLQMKELIFNISAITDLSTYTTKITVKTSETGEKIYENLIAQFDIFVEPKLDWKNFGNNKSDSDRLSLNKEILKDAFKPKVAPVLPSKTVEVEKPKPVVSLGFSMAEKTKPIVREKPRPVPVEKTKPIVREKPRPVPVEKPKPVKVEKPKVEKVVKQKVTKPKVEDDLSFLDDLDNIF
jgi:hypothetical protein